MKHTNALFLPLVLGLTFLAAVSAPAQIAGKRLRSPFAVQFQRAWTIALNDPVKLIEIGQTTNRKQNSLLMLVGGKDRLDTKRKLLVTHWDGFRFATDFTTEFLGNSVDALLVGHFRTAPVIPKVGHNKPEPPVTQQIVTTEGIYEWSGRAFARLFETPSELKLAIVLDKSPDQLLTGAGDKSIAYEVGEKDVHPSANESPANGDGYVRFGVGTQDFAGSDTMMLVPNVRYAQSHWANRNRWMVGLIKGQPANIPDYPNATIGDRLVVYVPKSESKDKTFWASRPDDLEESWRSEALPGRVLDVRVGDPKNDGKEGILVLLADKNGKNYQLVFYAVTGLR